MSEGWRIDPDGTPQRVFFYNGGYEFPARMGGMMPRKAGSVNIHEAIEVVRKLSPEVADLAAFGHYMKSALGELGFVKGRKREKGNAKAVSHKKKQATLPGLTDVPV